MVFRLAVGLGLAAALILVAAGWWNLRLQRGHLVAMVIVNATDRADDIRRSIHQTMMRNDPAEARRILETIAEESSITRVRLFDKAGLIRTSSDPTEVGTLVDTRAEQCVSCHGAAGVLEHLEREQRTRIFASDGARVLAVIAPIRNEPACATAPCHAHPQSQRVLGVLDLHLSLAEVDESLRASERQLMLGLSGSVGALLVAAWLLTWRLVLRPVERLTRAATRVAAGNLSTHIATTSEDEIGEMTRAWNSMIAKLGRAQVVLERWGRTLEQRVQEKTGELEKAHQHMVRVEKMASLGRLSAVVAHEINNPLTGIGTYARLLRKRRSQSTPAAADGGETDRILELIETEASRCGEIARNLLLFSRTPAAAFVREGIEPLLDRCLLLLHAHAEGEGVALGLEVAADLPPVECDPDQIQQMVLALGLNAIEATPRGGVVAIEVGPAADGELLVLRVRDTGHGIAAEHLDKIFEPFFTTKTEGRGVGLGLAVAYGIIQRHGGTIKVDSTPGSGTTFIVSLPLHQQPTEVG